MTVTEAIKRVVDRQNLTSDEAAAVLEEIMTGQCSDAQIAALLTALRMKGETVDELTGFARVMRQKASAVRPGSVDAIAEAGDGLIDTCGTGGDVSGTFNISTAAAFVAAGAGLRVAKHGNRSVSSRCGSADVIEALGIKIDLNAEQIGRCIDEVGVGFLYAPALHGAMKYVAAARKQMGIRTIFNMLGPLTNPAGARRQLIGVYAPDLTKILAGVLKNLGSIHVLVVHGSDGMDEITVTGETTVTELRDGAIRTYTIQPEDFGLRRSSIDEIVGGDAPRNAEIVLSVLKGQKSPRRDIVLMNAAGALVAGGTVRDLKQGIGAAEESIDSGRALEKVRQLAQVSNAAS